MGSSDGQLASFCYHATASGMGCDGSTGMETWIRGACGSEKASIGKAHVKRSVPTAKSDLEKLKL